MFVECIVAGTLISTQARCLLPDEETYRTRGVVVEIGWISVGVDGSCASKQARESETCHQVLHRGFSAELEQTRIVKNKVMLPNERMSEGSSERRDRGCKRCRETGTQQLCTYLSTTYSLARQPC